jgi:hypothetical protein
MEINDLLSKYSCHDYFEHDWHEKGYFCEDSQCPVIVPFDEVHEVPNAEFLAVGHAGSDGIDFGYRKDVPGIWAYYPIDRDFKYMSATIKELVAAWISGKLSV